MIKPNYQKYNPNTITIRDLTPSYAKNLKISERNLTQRKSGLHTKLITENQGSNIYSKRKNSQVETYMYRKGSANKDYQNRPTKFRTASNSPAYKNIKRQYNTPNKKHTDKNIRLQKLTTRKNKQIYYQILQKKQKTHPSQKDQKYKNINDSKINLQNIMKFQHVPGSHIKAKKKQRIDNKLKAQSKRYIIDQQLSREKDSRYQCLGELGKGAYAVVQLAIDKQLNQKVAIKVYKKVGMDVPNVQRQIKILKKIEHSNIARLLSLFETNVDFHIVLQYGGANSLFKYLVSKKQHRLDQQEAKFFFRQVLRAISYLHRNNLVHRDIKAQNILLNRYKKLKLIDFGFSLNIEPGQMIDTYCGTPTYMAPQIVARQPHCPIYTDLWSLGVLYYVITQGNYPFRGKNQNQLFDKIKLGKFEYMHPISKTSKQVIQSFLKLNPLERIPVDSLLTPKWDDWFSGISGQTI